MSGDIPLQTVGRILAGREAGRFVEVFDDHEKTGGYLIYTYADAERSPEVFDAWVEKLQDVEDYFRESRWRIDWQG